MEIKIRKEDVKDYHKIALINALAFTNENFIGELALVDTLRHGLNFDSELSLVALINDEVVGHILFYPFNANINNTIVQSVLLGPVAVLPKFQKLGIGGKLIKEGHEIAAKKGCKYSFLWGHDTYYPKLGYVTNMFGDATLKIKRSNIKKLDVKICERGLKEEDINLLNSMWDNYYGRVDLAIKPSNSLIDWINNYSNIRSKVLEIDNEVIGYLRYEKNNYKDIKMFLAKDKLSALQILSYIDSKLSDGDYISLPLHEQSVAKEAFSELTVEFNLETWGACMIKILDNDCKEIVKYCNDVENKNRKVGQVILPPFYEME